MDNYEHEIFCPDNKGIRNYLWSDYFHDSEIVNVSFDRQKRTVILTIECIRDQDEIWDKLKGDREARWAYVNAHMDGFT